MIFFLIKNKCVFSRGRNKKEKQVSAQGVTQKNLLTHIYKDMSK